MGHWSHLPGGLGASTMHSDESVVVSKQSAVSGCVAATRLGSLTKWEKHVFCKSLPKQFANAVMETVSELQRKHTLRLPELSSCESELEVLNSAESNPKRRRTTTDGSISNKKKEP